MHALFGGPPPLRGAAELWAHPFSLASSRLGEPMLVCSWAVASVGGWGPPTFFSSHFGATELVGHHVDHAQSWLVPCGPPSVAAAGHAAPFPVAFGDGLSSIRCMLFGTTLGGAGCGLKACAHSPRGGSCSRYPVCICADRDAGQQRRARRRIRKESYCCGAALPNSISGAFVHSKPCTVRRSREPCYFANRSAYATKGKDPQQAQGTLYLNRFCVQSLGTKCSPRMVVRDEPVRLTIFDGVVAQPLLPQVAVALLQHQRAAQQKATSVLRWWPPNTATFILLPPFPPPPPSPSSPPLSVVVSGLLLGVFC